MRSAAGASASSSRRNAVPSYSASVSAPFATANSATLRGGSVHPSASLTHAGFESRVLAARANTAQTESLSSYHSANSALISGAESEERAAHLRKIRRLQQQNAEWAMHFDLDNAAREKERRAVLQAQDALLAEALLQQSAARAHEENERRRVCEGSADIAALTEKLKAARLNAARHAQLLERQAAAKEERESDAAREHKAEAARAAAAARQDAEAAAAASASAERARVLRAQVEEKEQAKATAYEDFLREKAAVDAVVERIAAEDADKVARKRAAQAELQSVIARYLSDRAQWRAEEQRKAREELAAIAAYSADMERRRQAQAARMKEKSDRDDLIYAAISAEMERKEREREDMERMLEELYTEQKEQEVLREVEAQQRRAELLREDMRREHEAAQQRKREARALHQQAERELQAQMARQLESDAAFDAASREKRARMKAAYQREIAAAVDAKRDARAREAAAEEEQQRAQRAAQQRELDIVEAERERLLMQLATTLQPYLPKNVFRDAGEKAAIELKTRQRSREAQSQPQPHGAAAFSPSSGLPASFPETLSSSLSTSVPIVEATLPIGPPARALRRL